MSLKLVHYLNSYSHINILTYISDINSYAMHVKNLPVKFTC